MLVYQVIGPDAQGVYTLAYPTPGVPGNLTTAGSSKSKRLAYEECARLNELQVVDRRAVIRDRADRIVDDLPRDEKGRV
jgi:hypothetical protein